ncbi:MAG: electron transfer flavoprotein subunit beta/FixA family protein, partial [Methanobacteriota archaeon]
MNILVCMKQVPDTDKDIRVAGDGRDIERRGVDLTANEFDTFALEEAIRIKEKQGGEVTLVTVGEDKADEVLRAGLAKGAAKAIRVSDPAAAGSDPLATAKILAAVAKKGRYDLVLCGQQAEDDGAAVVGPALAALLGMPHASTCLKVASLANGRAKVHREMEGGSEQVVDLSLPAVLTIQTGINEPRLASLMAILQAKNKPLTVMKLADLGLDAGA